MNAEQQKGRHGIVLQMRADLLEKLEQTENALMDVLDAYKEELKGDIEREKVHRSTLHESLLNQIGAECTARLKLADEQRYYVDYQNIRNGVKLTAFTGMTFLNRVRWFFGRAIK